MSLVKIYSIKAHMVLYMLNMKQIKFCASQQQ